MTHRSPLAQILLWAFVITTGIGVGAGLYEWRTIMPLWSGSPPESVRGWRDLLAANPQYAPHGGDRFWIFVTPGRTLLAIAVLLTSLRMPAPHRGWRLAASAITLVLFAIAAAWLIPTSADLFGSGSSELRDTVVVSKTRGYITMNYVFQALGLAAFLAGLRAISLESAP